MSPNERYVEAEVEWVDPPDKGPGRGPAYNPAFLEQLVDNPGQWGKLHTYNSDTAAYGAATALRKKGYEAKAADKVLYARWPEGEVAK